MVTIEQLYRVQSGDQEAFEAVLREWEPWVSGSVSRVWRVPVVGVDDLKQEIRVELWHGIFACDLSLGEGSAVKYLRSVVPLRAIDWARRATHWRSRTRVYCMTDIDPSGAILDGLVDTTTPRHLVAEDFEDRIKMLDSDLREIVTMHFADQMTYAEIGERVGCGISAVHRRIQKGLDLLGKK